MKIAYILPSLANAAPIHVIELLSRLMVQNGHCCCVYYFDEKSELEFTCPTYRIDSKTPIDFTLFDIVHSTGVRPDMYVARFREFRGKTKYITTIHNFFIEDFTSQYNWFIAHIYGRLWMRNLNKLDCVVTLSNVGVKYYSRWIKKAHLTYAYNARTIDKSAKLSVEEIVELNNFKGSCKLIGLNAMLSPVKGVDLIIKAVRELPNYKIFIVGEGKARKKLEQLVERLNVRDRCLFVGFKKDAYRYLFYYDIYAIPSRSEGFPLALLEAAQYRLPTICSNIAIFQEIFSEDEVMFFDLNDIHTLIDAIKNVTINIEMRERFFHRYQMCYTPEKMYERYLAIYNGKI